MADQAQQPVKLVVLGAGLIGKRHVDHVFEARGRGRLHNA
jgi:hypothetical protein